MNYGALAAWRGHGPVVTAGSSLLTGLVAYWKLGEASGERADSVGASNLTDNNTVTQAAGRVGNAAQFTAANSEYLSIADNAALSMADIDFTLVIWAYFDSLGADRYLITKRSITASHEYQILVPSGGSSVRFYVSPDGTGGAESFIEKVFAFSTGTWYMIEAYHDAANNEIGVRVNNGAAATTSWTTGVFNGTAAFFLGAGNFAGAAFDHYDGRLDACGVWKRVLTADERTALYNGGAGVEHPFA